MTTTTKIKTNRLTIFPLNADQLSNYLNAPKKLEKQLGYRISRNIVDENLQRAIKAKLSNLPDLSANDQVWLAYWLIKINQPPFGAGLVGFKGKPDLSGTVEIGYGIDSEVWNQGYMTEAVKAMISWAFEQPACLHICARRTTNPASEHILKKLGFKMIETNNDSNTWMINKNLEKNTFHWPEFKFHSIGMINTPFENAIGTPIQPTASNGTPGIITLHPDYIPALNDLDGFSHIILLYVFDRTGPAKHLVKPFMDDIERGLFSTRAPARPNPIGISVVRLIRIEENKLYVSGVDMLNNTPLLDIKPFVPQFNPTDDLRLGWLESKINRLDKTSDDGRFNGVE